MKVKVEINACMLSRSRRVKTWARVVDEVDRSVSTGYAFRGDWLRVSALNEVKAGSIVLLYEHDRKHGACVAVGRVCASEGGEGEVRWFSEKGQSEPDSEHPVDLISRPRSWALEIRDWVADLVEGASERRPLQDVPTSDLIAELRARADERGVTVEALLAE